MREHQLGAAYLEAAQQWFAPLAARLAAHQKSAARPVLYGLNGSQGSGKTTLVDYLRQSLERDHGLRCAALSLDDFYLTRAARRTLADTVHPLFATRGVPGTHDNALMLRTLRRALSPEAGELAIPRFDKARDDRCPQADWERVELPLDVVLLEGWCLGVEAQPAESLARPENALERDEDAAGIWRKHVNAVLARDFPPVYRLVDQWIMLKAPSFDCVLRWRREQEDKLRQRLGPGALEKTMDAAAVARFVQYYQRLTEVALATLPSRVDYLYVLDEQRQVLREGH
nr:hypothetical protein [Parahaliea mediterranea]